ncbi:hypothetical protein Tco_0805424, partial [Tanacetum coccineum]
KSEEVFKNTKLPRGEFPEKGTTTQFRGSRPTRHSYGSGPSRTYIHPRRDHYQSYVSPRAPDKRYDNRRHDHRRQDVNHVRLYSLTKLPSEILAMELQLQLPPCLPTVAPPKKENLDRYCEYHDEKGHYIKDGFHLKKQLEVALESGKLNHLIKDVRQRGNNQGRLAGNNNGRGKRQIGPDRRGRSNDGTSGPRSSTCFTVVQKEKGLGNEENRVDGTWECEECVLLQDLNVNKPKRLIIPAGNLPHKSNRHGPPFSSAFLDDIQGLSSCPKGLIEDKRGPLFTRSMGLMFYVKMPFGLKNAGATYQRLVDSAFQAQLGRNLEAYVDDMVIKSKTEQDMIMDIAETFDNL